jgi:threonine dehydrogenase-like Zn-dependent dehydrogenase
MKAAQIVAPRKYVILDIADPDMGSQAPGSLLIKTGRTALCGSDMPSFSLEAPPSHYPRAPGISMHECIGIVAASRSPSFREGDPVLAVPRGLAGFAECFLADDTATVALPRYEHQDRLLMAQPLGTVVWACRKLGNLLNRDAVVVGQGPMGLLMAHMLSNLGVRNIIVTDVLDYRLAVAPRMGATHTVNSAKENAAALVADITKGRMADLVIEAVGHEHDTINGCLDLVKRGGTIVAFGVPDSKMYNFRFSDFFRKNVHFIGSVGQEIQADVPLAMEMIMQGRIDVTPIITHHLPFTEAQRGFELSLHKREQAIKIIFEYD